MNSNKLKRLLINTQVLKSDLVDLKKYSYFLKKNNYIFSFYNYKIIYQQLKMLVYILKSSRYHNQIIAFMGLSKKDHSDYIIFNTILKKFVLKKGHIYVDNKLNGFLYNRWSLYKRQSNPSNFFLNLQKNNKFPVILISFSKETNNAVFREFSKFGIPIIYLLEGYKHFDFKDYPILGSYSRKMLNFYLNILQYCLK